MTLVATGTSPYRPVRGALRSPAGIIFRIRSIGGESHALDGDIEGVEPVAADARRDLRAHSARHPILLDDESPVRLFHRCVHARHVEGTQRAQVDHLAFDAGLRQLLRRAQRNVQHPGVGDDRDVPSGAFDVRYADRQGVLPVRHLPLDAVKPRMLDEHDRVIGPDRGLEKPLGVVRGGRHHDEQSGHVGEPGFEALRVGRRKLPPAGRHANDERHPRLASEHGMDLRYVVDDLVHRHQAEVDRHQLRDRPQAAHRRPDRGSDDRFLRDRGVQDPPAAELVVKPPCDRVGTPPHAHLFSHDQDAFVAQHLFPQRFPNGIPIRLLRHGSPTPGRARR
ncbi:MAG: hypothetical protein H6Q79_2904 [Deltaproteobacteria bacterium]|nr:hypothetical protein [Deltaproteobacteria bacterium]